MASPAHHPVPALLPPPEETEVVVGPDGSRKRWSRVTPVAVLTVGPWRRSSITWRSTWRSSWRISGSSASSSATSSPAARLGSTKNCKWWPGVARVSVGPAGQRWFREPGWNRGWGTGIGKPGPGLEPHPLSRPPVGLVLPSLLAPGCRLLPARPLPALPCSDGFLQAQLETFSCQTKSFCSGATYEEAMLHYLSLSLRTSDALPEFPPNSLGNSELVSP